MSTKQNETVFLAFQKLAEYKDIKHLSTTRIGGHSEGKYAGFNLGLTVNDQPAHVAKNREILAQALDVEQSKFIFPGQTHSANVGLVKKDVNNFPETDALITNEKGFVLCVQTADCVPVLLYDPINEAIAAIHSGWKGTAQKIVTKTIESLVDNYNTNPQNLIAGIGPSIGPDKYEVGSEVVEKMTAAGLNNPETILPHTAKDKAYLNLWAANKKLLLHAGLKEENIEVSGLCTYTDEQYFYSARRDGIETGRMVTCIMLK